MPTIPARRNPVTDIERVAVARSGSPSPHAELRFSISRASISLWFGRRATLLLLLAAAPCFARSPQADAVVRAGIAAQGGEKALRSLSTVRWHATGYRNELEQSERPEGPWMVEADSVEQEEDLARNRIRSLTSAKVVPFPAFTTGFLADQAAAVRLSGGQMIAGNFRLLLLSRETLALSPERLLLTALTANDLDLVRSSILQGVPQDVVRFTLDDAPVTIFLNRYTHLPTAVDYDGPVARSGYWAFGGDTRMRTYFSYWWLGEHGLKIPLQRNVERNGLPESVETIDELEINGQIAGGVFDIPADLRQHFDKDPKAGDLEALPLGDPKRPPVELAPGITLIPGRWNVTIVRQPDGIVIIEAPISSGYSTKVIDEVARRYPHEPVKALVSTSDSWPHIAGIREYAARGIPIFCLDLNQPIIRRWVSAPHSRNPDFQQQRKRLPRLVPVSDHVAIGAGANRIDLYPLRGETSERQMFVWFPEQKLLYGSDPFQRSDSGSYTFPQTVDELKSAAARNHLDPNTFFMMHMGPTPWADLAKVVGSDHLREPSKD